MSTLRLGAYNLPAAEVVLVQTLFRLFAHGDAFRWTFVTAPPYDALLVDGTRPEGMKAEVDRMARAVLRLVRLNGGDAQNTLERPIRADRLQEWLKQIEHDLLTTLQAASGQDDHPEPPVASSPVRFKLRRWPPATLLRGDPHRIRMATMLSRRALNAAELATISQQPAEACQAFLMTLQTTGLVDVRGEAPPRPAPSADQLAKAAPAKPAFARSLISGIRKRLGL